MCKYISNLITASKQEKIEQIKELVKSSVNSFYTDKTKTKLLYEFLIPDLINNPQTIDSFEGVINQHLEYDLQKNELIFCENDYDNDISINTNCMLLKYDTLLEIELVLNESIVV